MSVEGPGGAGEPGSFRSPVARAVLAVGCGLVAFVLVAALSPRPPKRSELVEDTLFLNLPVRLAKKLVAYAASHGRRTAEGVRIELKLSQEEWGDFVGATRESINKQMRQWTDQGLIRVDHGCVVLLRPEAFEALAGSPMV